MNNAERAALQGLLDHIGDMQERMRAYLKPDSGIRAEIFAAEIVDLLDGPLQRARVKAAREALHAMESDAK